MGLGCQLALNHGSFLVVVYSIAILVLLIVSILALIEVTCSKMQWINLGNKASMSLCIPEFCGPMLAIFVHPPGWVTLLSHDSQLEKFLLDRVQWTPALNSGHGERDRMK